MRTYEFEFNMIDNTTMVVEVDADDGSILQAVKHDRGLSTDVNVTSFIKNSTAWNDSINERFQNHKSELRQSRSDWKLTADR